MKTTIIIEQWIINNNGRIQKIETITETNYIKHKKIIKNIKKILKTQGRKIITTEFTIINHNEKKVEYITSKFKFTKGKERYIEEIKKIEKNKE